MGWFLQMMETSFHLSSGQLDFISYFFFFPVFIFLIAVQSIVFLFVSRSRKEKQWNKRFYFATEAFEDSKVPPSVVWSFLTDSEKFMNLNYKNKIKWVKFEQPLKLGSSIRIRIRKGYVLKGFLSFFEQESRIVFEYHVWPNSTRYIYEIEMIPLKNETRYILRIKTKKLIAPLVKKLYPRLDEKVFNLISATLRSCLAICEKNHSEKKPQELSAQIFKEPNFGILEEKSTYT